MRLFLKNSYQDINLPDEVVKHVTEKRKLAFRLTFFSAALYFFFTYFIALGATDVKINFPIYATLHELWLCIFPIALIILFIIWEHFVYRAKYLKLTMVIMYH